MLQCRLATLRGLRLRGQNGLAGGSLYGPVNFFSGPAPNNTRPHASQLPLLIDKRARERQFEHENLDSSE